MEGGERHTIRDESFVAASTVNVLPNIDHNGTLGQLGARFELESSSALHGLDWLGSFARENQVEMSFWCGRESGSNVEVGYRPITISLDKVGERGAEDGGKESGCKEELHFWSVDLMVLEEWMSECEVVDGIWGEMLVIYIRHRSAQCCLLR